MPNQSDKRIIVPKLPGSDNESRARENLSVSMSLNALGILKIPKILSGLVKYETFFNDALSINLYGAKPIGLDENMDSKNIPLLN